MLKIHDIDSLDIRQVRISEWLPHVVSLRAILSQDECERADRFATQALVNSYVCTRGLLRRLLSHYLSIDAAEIQFAYSAHGKPYLLSGHSKPPLYFNMSHAGDCAVYAFCREHECGIDVEDMQRHMSDHLAIAKRFFTAEEYAELQNLPESGQIQRFFYLWTRKEALLKATGKGLTQALDSIDVRKPHVADNTQLWQLHTLDVEAPYCLSAAVMPSVTRLQLSYYAAA